MEEKERDGITISASFELDGWYVLLGAIAGIVWIYLTH